MSSDLYTGIETELSEKQTTQKTSFEHNKKAVYRALAANLGISAIKFICWWLSRSSSLLSEAIHSLVDGFNSVCLLIGLKRGNRPADKMHPFGYGLEANIWSGLASLFMLVATFIAISHGLERLFSHGEGTKELLDNYHWLAITLVGSACFEAWAVISASKAVLEEAEQKIVSNNLVNFIHSIKFIRKIKSPTTKFVWYEDTAAFSGVVIAFIAVSISKFAMPYKYAYIPDAVASIIIGLILLFLAGYLIKNNINSLTAAGAGPHTERLITEITNNVYGVSRLVDLKTIDLGASGVIINMKIEVNPEIPMKEADDIAQKVENKIRKVIKRVADITIEMIADDVSDNWKDKFEKLIKEGLKNEVLTNDEAKMLNKFFDFTVTVASEIMIPRTNVIFADTETSIEELTKLIIETGHTRIPVYKDVVDNVIGVINAKDVLKATKDENVTIESLVRELHIIPETKPISELLTEFTSTKTQFALVIDEHGGVAGIVTLEDILEEIVGEIYDEFDTVESAEYYKVDNKTLKVNSKMEIEELNKKFDLDLSIDDYQTIGGYVFGLLGREPEVNQEVEENGLKFVINEVDGHKITKLTIIKEDGFIEK